MKKILSLLSVVACLAALTFSATSCNKDDDGEITNKMILRGSTLPIARAFYFVMEDGFYNLDVDTTNGDDNLHGYGGFPADMIGKTTDLSGKDFFLSFNPMSGNSIDPTIESGTVTIKEVSEGLHIIVDCMEVDNEKFYMNFLAVDESKIDWNSYNN